MRSQNQNSFPLYGCLTGIDVPIEHLEVAPGVALRKVFVDMFAAPMLAFNPPKDKMSAHPGPWIAVKGGISFESRVELSISDNYSLQNISPTAAAWLIAVVLRLQMKTLVRLAVIGNMPFDRMGAERREASAYPFEIAPQQVGLFDTGRDMATAEDLAWLRDIWPIALQLYPDERFLKAMHLYNQAQWSPSQEMGAVLIFSALETLFEIGKEQNKTRSLSKAVSDYICIDRRCRDRYYQAVKTLYEKRGSVVHAGGTLTVNDLTQCLQIARECFRRVLIERALPRDNPV